MISDILKTAHPATLARQEQGSNCIMCMQHAHKRGPSKYANAVSFPTQIIGLLLDLLHFLISSIHPPLLFIVISLSNLKPAYCPPIILLTTAAAAVVVSNESRTGCMSHNITISILPAATYSPLCRFQVGFQHSILSPFLHSYLPLQPYIFTIYYMHPLCTFVTVSTLFFCIHVLFYSSFWTCYFEVHS